MTDSLSCTIFISEGIFFNNSVTSIVDVRHIVMSLLWRFNDVTTFSDVNLNDGVRDVHSTSAYQTRENSRFSSYPG